MKSDDTIESSPEIDPAISSLDTTVINDILKSIDSFEEKIKGKTGEEVIEMRTRQLCLSKILVNIYSKDIFYLIKGYTMLGISYIDKGYIEQAQEHLFNAFKLIENLSDNSNNITLKEFQVKILINLLKGEDHLSNADMLFVLARVKIFVNFE